MRVVSSGSRFRSRIGRAVTAASVLAAVAAASAVAAPCTAPDDGGGTAALPPAAPTGSCPNGYLSPSEKFQIVDGLPPGTTIDIAGELTGFAGITAGPGGSLAGEIQDFGAQLAMQMQGAGTLAGYTRSLTMANLTGETHSAPRAAGAAAQSFDTVFHQLQGQLPPGDPDFDLLRITAGTGFGLPSPGHTTLMRFGAGTWNVDSFFDLAYRIDFVGAPGGLLAGRSGSTTGTIRLQLGQAAIFDHLECFGGKDPLKLKGVVSLPSLAGGLYDAVGCKIGKAKKYCTPVAKIVTASSVTVAPLVGQSLVDDYVCYPIRCPKVKITQGIVDQFGPRVLAKLRQKELCVPAQRAP
ncbi:MAG: hypothetical protein IT294_01325 [Deltaproteobacteria bacterium]|nr:hypothetical protein [Deltaproteobacteria bacterium]